MIIQTSFHGIAITGNVSEIPTKTNCVEVRYVNYHATIQVSDGQIVEGDVPYPVYRMTKQWLDHHLSKMLRANVRF